MTRRERYALPPLEASVWAAAYVNTPLRRRGSPESEVLARIQYADRVVEQLQITHVGVS